MTSKRHLRKAVASGDVVRMSEILSEDASVMSYAIAASVMSPGCAEAYAVLLRERCDRDDEHDFPDELTLTTQRIRPSGHAIVSLLSAIGRPVSSLGSARGALSGEFAKSAELHDERPASLPDALALMHRKRTPKEVVIDVMLPMRAGFGRLPYFARAFLTLCALFPVLTLLRFLI